MILPKIDVPKFKLTIPGSNKSYTFRPFLVKENNILTQSATSGDIDSQFMAIKQIVENCCLDNIDVNSLPLYQLQWIFLQLKGKSVGDEQEFIITCGSCEHKINYTMKVHDFEILGLQDSDTKKIMISDNSGIVFKMPSAEVQIAGNDLSDTELVINCIDYIFTEDEVLKPQDIPLEELAEFIENLPIPPIQEAIQFFANVPMLAHVKDYECTKCGKQNKISITGIDHFFV